MNGKKISFYFNATSPKVCLVVTALWIVCCTIALGQKPTCPLGIQPSSNPPTPFTYITSSNITAFLHLAAVKVHKLSSNHSDVQAWSPHPICITTANLLHCTNFSNSFIQNPL